ncbi:MAG TPA: Asp-tRNA(Asn)/Glu-tRNA(Gln) amidotransferase subunit GatC [Candidatus Paceibacterota bacterium]|jgi:aspartyl/glutamyl-tRNA(Asn/Gln) amidotransferase C subunit|nr:Asp-tRNA(Asn)/Glu-tRNA(Gln) amidotransferase subunit GatC [Candidatus Paceibacterota bacterium]
MAEPKVDIKALAELARLEVSDAELAKLEKEIPDILHFVEQIQKASGDAAPTSPELRNVMRADENPHETGKYTDKLLEAAPKREGDRIVVQQVVSRKQK